MKHTIKITVLLFVVLVTTSFTSQQKTNVSYKVSDKLVVFKIENAKMDLTSNASVGGNKKND